MSEIDYFCYSLYSRGSLNAVSLRREFRGALIRVNGGIGCLHPWPEFGDEMIDVQLGFLRQNVSSKVIERALRMAAVDGEARQCGQSLFKDLVVPPCHYSWDQNVPFEPQIEQVISEGWKAIKTKGWKDVSGVLKWLETFEKAVQSSTLKLRIDFNSCLSKETFRELLANVPDSLRKRLDFVEDPFPYDPETWSAASSETGVCLALDKQLRGANRGFDVAVLKPGRRDWREMCQGLPVNVRVVMTSAMDHAIGQSFAAWEAATAWRELGGRLDLCGLSTQHLFAEDAFFEKLHAYGGILEVDRNGTGLGFDDILTALPWKRL